MIATEKPMENQIGQELVNSLNVNKEIVYYAVYIPGESEKNSQGN